MLSQTDVSSSHVSPRRPLLHTTIFIFGATFRIDSKEAQTWAVSNGCHDSVSSIGGSQLGIDSLPSRLQERRVDSIINISIFRKIDSSQKGDRSYFLQVGGIDAVK